MADFPIHMAIEELINIIFLEQKKNLSFDNSSVVTVEIKSEFESRFKDDQCLYRINISGKCKVANAIDHMQKGLLQKLPLIIKKTQNFIKSNSNFCEIERCSASTTGVMQRSYVISEHPETRKDQIIISESQVEKKLPYKFNFNFRVYHQRQPMMTECRTIYEYLQKLRIFNPEDIFEFNLEIAGMKCDLSFPPFPIFEIKGKKTLNTIEYHAKQTVRKNKQIEPILGPSLAMNIFNGNEHVLKLNSIALNIHSNILKNEECKMYLIEFFLFGPYGEPLHAPPVIKEEISNLVLWEKYGLKLVSTNLLNSSNHTLKPEWFIVAQPDTINVSKENYFHFVIYLKFEISRKSDLWNMNILGELHNNTGSVLHKNKFLIKDVIQGMTDQLLMHRLTANRKENEEDNAINTISDSIWNIVLRSTNEDFRENCLLTLGATSVHELKVLVEKKLRTIKTSKKPLVCHNSQESLSSFDMLEQVCPDLHSMNSFSEGFQK